MKERFYFTFGSDEEIYPYRGGWVEVFADNEDMARELFNKHFGYTKQGAMRYSSCYAEVDFCKTSMYARNMNLGKSVWEVLEGK